MSKYSNNTLSQSFCLNSDDTQSEFKISSVKRIFTAAFKCTIKDRKCTISITELENEVLSMTLYYLILILILIDILKIFSVYSLIS
jgi:hypothetical protein